MHTKKPYTEFSKTTERNYRLLGWVLILLAIVLFVLAYYSEAAPVLGYGGFGVLLFGLCFASGLFYNEYDFEPPV